MNWVTLDFRWGFTVDRLVVLLAFVSPTSWLLFRLLACLRGVVDLVWHLIKILYIVVLWGLFTWFWTLFTGNNLDVLWRVLWGMTTWTSDSTSRKRLRFRLLKKMMHRRWIVAFDHRKWELALTLPLAPFLPQLSLFELLHHWRALITVSLKECHLWGTSLGCCWWLFHLRFLDVTALAVLVNVIR